MKRFSEQFNKKAQNIRMSASERRDLRERLVSYMEYHPMQNTTKAKVSRKKTIESIVSDPFTVLSIPLSYIRGFAGAFALFLVVGVPFFAERSVPGDVLYPVKIQFNEEVRSTLSFSPYAKVEWETERLERRLAEARLLADEGKLTDELQAEVALAVQGHSSAAQQEIAMLRENDSDGAALAEITFASALAVQSEVLDNRVAHEGEGAGQGRSVSALAGVVAEARSDAEAAQTASAPSYEKLLARIETETTRAQELFTSVRSGASTEERVDIERRLSDIQRKVSEAIELHNSVAGSVTETSEEGVDVKASTTLELVDEIEINASSTTDSDIPVVLNTPEENVNTSILLLRGALTDTRKLISFMTDIDVRSGVTVEELVPVTLTNEERVALLEKQYAEVHEMQQQLSDVTVQVSFREKFILGKKELDGFMKDVDVALATKSLLRADSLLKESKNIADDLLKMIEFTQSIDAEETTSASSTKEIIEESVLPEGARASSSNII